MAIAFDARELSASWQESTRKRRLLLLVGLGVFGSLGIARLVLAFDVAVAAAVIVSLALIAVLVRPRYGLYLLFALLLLFEGGGDDPLMTPGYYLNRSLQQSLGLSGAIVIPIEMLLVLAVAAWFAGGVMRRRLDFQPGAFGRPMLMFGLALAFGVVRGLIGGGNVNYTFWESRFLFAMVLTYVLTTNVIRTREHVQTLMSLITVCVSLSAIEGVWRRFALANTGELGIAPETWFQHDDVVVWGLLIMLVIAQQVFGGPRWQRIVGPVALLITVLVLLLSERRAGQIAVMIAFIAFAGVLLFVKPKAFLFIGLPVLLAGIIYLPLFWNNTGTLGQPARAVKSLSAPDARDAASNAWRGLEALNVQATIASDPLLGIGFGVPFLQVVAVPSIASFEFWNYESHHDILWVWMKTGAIGFICFFIVITSALARAVWLIKTLEEPEFKNFAVIALSAILMTATFCYVDLGLTGSRLPTILGVAIGTLGVLDRIHKSPSRA